MDKEYLLKLGIPEDKAMEILAKAESDGSEDDSLTALQKALGDDELSDSLFKAGGEDDDDDDDDDDDEKGSYDEKFMKNMKKYMKENPAMCKKMMSNMTKAMDDFNTDAEGAVVEMEDLTPVLESMSETVGTLAKAVSDIYGKLEVIASHESRSYDLMKKAAVVQVEQAKSMDAFLSTPSGRKSVAVVDLKKAKTTENVSNSQLVWNTLMKAVKSGVEHASDVMDVYESRGRDINKLGDVHKVFISNLLKEGE